MDYSESMHLDGGFLHPVLDKERGDLGALVSLQLDHFAHLFVVNDSTIASEFLHDVYKSVNKFKEQKDNLEKDGSMLMGAIDVEAIGGEQLLTFLKALRSFFWSYSNVLEGETVKSMINPKANHRKRTYVSVNPARWSESYDRYAVGYGCGYSRKWSQRRQFLRAGHLRQQRDLFETGVRIGQRSLIHVERSITVSKMKPFKNRHDGEKGTKGSPKVLRFCTLMR